MNYIRLEIAIQSDYQEYLIAELLERDFEGFEQENDRLIAYIPQERFSDVYREEIEQWLSAQRDTCYIIKESIEEPRDWNEEWEQTIQPQLIGQFYVRPTWIPTAAPEGKILIEIDPKMAFGTGYHETTRLMLRLLPEFISKDARVLDVGTGTGILSIAALKLGAHSAYGFDIDEWSYDNANENALLNGVAEHYKVNRGSFEVVATGDRFDVILANVNRNAILGMAKHLTGHLKEKGVLLLSGLLENERNYILEDKNFASLKFLKELQEGEWISLAFRNE